MSAIDPGEGWRLLKPGERRRPGDEVYYGVIGAWYAYDKKYDCGTQKRGHKNCRRRIANYVKPASPMTAQPAPTEIEERVIAKMRERRERGRAKYGTTMERTDLKRIDWLRHAQEEAMDLAIYLERLIRDEEDGR